MPKESMTPRERWLAVLQRQTPDRVPMDYWTTNEARDKLMKHLGVADDRALYRRLHIDRVVSVGPRYVGPPIPEGQDVFGIQHRIADYGVGTYSEVAVSPLAQYNSVEEIEANYRWPDPDWWDYSDVPDQIVGLEDYPIRGGGSEPFLTYKSLRGQEQAFMDLALNPEIVHYCLDKLFDLAYKQTERIYAAVPGKVMISYVAEDMGSQETLMFSPKQIHEFLLPRMKRMIDLAHSAGVYVFHHSDGAVRRILPDMIAAGIDVLNPIQWRCKGMEREGLKRDFGDQLVFHGGVDNQYTLAFGSVAEVRQEVLDNLRILGAGGGYILAPCHNIQAVSPAENIVAMYETGYEHGWC
ncbi:MAG: uroporphyrinogen-III decarboxylase-like protein [Chloroflexi bacterium]|nr:uroporphyrinogen-III decarboxylase-like protein [Chloroflexota bacterium]